MISVLLVVRLRIVRKESQKYCAKQLFTGIYTSDIGFRENKEKDILPEGQVFWLKQEGFKVLNSLRLTQHSNIILYNSMVVVKLILLRDVHRHSWQVFSTLHTLSIQLLLQFILSTSHFHIMIQQIISIGFAPARSGRTYLELLSKFFVTE